MVVRIRDKRAGGCFWLLLFLTAVSIILGYCLLYRMSYLVYQSPVGSVRVSLQSPQTRGQVPVAVNELPYCSQAQAQYYGFPNKPCLNWDENLVLYPPEEATAAFVSTRVTQTYQAGNCSQEQPMCTYVDVNSTEIYIADIGNFTILVDHSIQASDVGIHANSEDLPGSLLDSQGNEVTDHEEGDSVGVKGNADVIHIGTLLRAAGIDSLDTASFANESRSKRDDGLVIMIYITYSNTYTYDLNNIRYQYSLRVVEDTKYKIMQPIYNQNIDSRAIWNRHGIRFIFQQTGELGKFDLITLALTLNLFLSIYAGVVFCMDNCVLWALGRYNSLHNYSEYRCQRTPAYHEINRNAVGPQAQEAEKDNGL